jgi:hypothetical protein
MIYEELSGEIIGAAMEVQLTTNPPSSRLRRDRWTRIHTKERTADYTDNTDWERTRARAPICGAASLFPTIRDICEPS